ncbi:hypothetical protein [uncultured Fibrobacter sp.]|uniref:hypothetical protein n=1 Tax=uncultured Fibrobacter sp. TaxID=261512 RepID=UPI0025F1E85F|nr:hypothetical protein [uncultured Fibrobacter sp.]
MKKKFVLLSFLLIGALALSACLFDSDEDGLGNWLSDQGLPNSYKVQTVSINGLVPSEVGAYRDSTPLIMNSRIAFGNSANMSHEMALEFLYVADTSFLNRFKNADTIGAYISFNMYAPFYKDKNIPVERLPIKEKLKVQVSWTLRKGKSKAFVDSLASVSDSAWQRGMQNWEPDLVVDTTYSIKVKKADTLVYFDMPEAFLDSIKTCDKACHLEVRFAAPETENLYRFYAKENKKDPVFRMRAVKEGDTLNYFKQYPPCRMANVVISNDCSDCLVLHGGVKDSIVFEYPAEPVLNALAEFYGDEFPYKEGDGYDVRQAVVLAQLTFARDDSESENYLGLPILVAASSFADSASGKEYRISEPYTRFDKKYVVANGHQNIVFYGGDSLTLQVTQGLRNFLNRASNGAKLKFMINLSYPQLLDNDSSFQTRIVEEELIKKRVFNGDTIEMKYAKGDTVYKFLSYYDYARYDFSTMMQKPATLKLWLATKRGGDDE